MRMYGTYVEVGDTTVQPCTVFSGIGWVEGESGNRALSSWNDTLLGYDSEG